MTVTPPHVFAAYDNCENPTYSCTHDTGRGVDALTLVTEEGPYAQGFVWDPESEAAIRAAGDWNQEIQDEVKKIRPQPIPFVFRGTPVNA